MLHSNEFIYRIHSRCALKCFLFNQKRLRFIAILLCYSKVKQKNMHGSTLFTMQAIMSLCIYYNLDVIKPDWRKSLNHQF